MTSDRAGAGVCESAETGERGRQAEELGHGVEEEIQEESFQMSQLGTGG